jgi:DNA polymerase III alpha subunit (gram-positive type)
VSGHTIAKQSLYLEHQKGSVVSAVVVRINAYCVPCKESRESELLEEKKTDSGRTLLIGVCPQCGSTIKRVGR